MVMSPAGHGNALTLVTDMIRPSESIGNVLSHDVVAGIGWLDADAPVVSEASHRIADRSPRHHRWGS